MTNQHQNNNVFAHILAPGYQSIEQWQKIIGDCRQQLDHPSTTQLLFLPPQVWRLPARLIALSDTPLLQTLTIRHRTDLSDAHQIQLYQQLSDQLSSAFPGSHVFLYADGQCQLLNAQPQTSPCTPPLLAAMTAFAKTIHQQTTGTINKAVEQSPHLIGGTQWMGIINATPDSFSDGGLNDDLDTLRESVENLLAEGSAIIDLGGQSTRPGADILDVDTEWQRVAPAIRVIVELLNEWPFAVELSIDTYHPEIARRAIVAGATMINDVSGLSHPDMRQLVREFPSVSWVSMHHLGLPADKTVTLDTTLTAEQLIGKLNEWASTLLASLDTEDCRTERLYLDPGIGFGKTAQQNALILQQISALTPEAQWLVGHSRKSYLNPLLTDNHTLSRDVGTMATCSSLIEQGCPIIRVHNVAMARLTERSYLATAPS